MSLIGASEANERDRTQIAMNCRSQESGYTDIEAGREHMCAMRCVGTTRKIEPQLEYTARGPMS